jgi:hypothetical protein
MFPLFVFEVVVDVISSGHSKVPPEKCRGPLGIANNTAVLIMLRRAVLVLRLCSITTFSMRLTSGILEGQLFQAKESLFSLEEIIRFPSHVF